MAGFAVIAEGQVSPAGDESVKIAEDFLVPQIETAFAWIPVRQFNDGNVPRNFDPSEHTESGCVFSVLVTMRPARAIGPQVRWLQSTKWC